MRSSSCTRVMLKPPQSLPGCVLSHHSTDQSPSKSALAAGFCRASPTFGRKTTAVGGGVGADDGTSCGADRAHPSIHMTSIRAEEDDIQFTIYPTAPTPVN